MRQFMFASRKNNFVTKASKCFASACVLLSVGTMLTADSAVASGKKVSTGQTQVIAKVNNREITHSEIRVEMARLSLIPTDPNAERIAMQAIVDRIVAAEAAREAKVDRRPDAMWRMEAAKEQALADLYISLVAQPVEPTRAEVQDYMLENPSLFTEARRYSFSVLEIETQDFDVDQLSPLFDETSNFDKLSTYLDRQQTPYMLSASVRPASSFPIAIREQLAAYDVSDNIVLRGADKVSILKIMRITNDSVTLDEGTPAARAILRREDATKKVTNRIEQLRKNADVVYYRDTVKPVAKPVLPTQASQKGQ